MAKKKKGLSDDIQEPNIDMGSMIDCVFLLIMFFMVVSTIDTVKFSKEVKLPIADSARAEENEMDRFLVDIEWDESQQYAVYKTGTITIGHPSDLVSLIQIAKQRSNPERFRVVIRADKRVPYEFTQEVMGAVADADVANMMFSTLEVDLSAGSGGG